MAKVNRNILLNGLSGTVGDQLVIKRVRGGGTIVTNKPTFSANRIFSAEQLAHQQAFQEATAYGKAMKREPIYVALAEGTAKTGYNIAVGDWFNPPKILEVDLSRWTNGGGSTIRVCAQDDVKVVQVGVGITDRTGTLLEEGEAREVGALWWEYSTAQSAGDGKQVTVYARDLPGHTTELKA